MGKPPQDSNLIAPWLEGLERFIEGEIRSLSFGEPVPMTIFTVFIG
jgi:hypothetical protein